MTVPIPKRSLFNGSCLFRHIGFLGVKIGAKSDIMERPETLFFGAKTTTKSCREGGTEIGSGFGHFDCPHPEAAETGSGLRGFHRLSVWFQVSFRLCGSLRQPIHIWAQWVSAMTMASSG